VIKQAVLLAAGSARRMGSLATGLPKCLLSIGGQSIVSRALTALAQHEISRVTIVDGFAGDLLREALSAQFPPGFLRFIRNERYAETNNAYSLRLALGGTPEPFLLLDSDVVFDAGAIGKLLNDPHPNRLALRSRGAWGEEDMKVALRPDGSVARIGKDVPAEGASGESVGLEAFSASFAAKLLAALTQRLESLGHDEWYEAAFQQLIDGGEAIHAVDLKQLRAIEIDTPEDLERARALFA
jgi:choline kinase